MSAFEDFIQIELPKRPYTNTDTAQESVLVRRGPGPRQHVGVELLDGQVVGKVGGVVQGVANGVMRSFKLEVASPTITWNVAHNLNSEELVVQIFDETKTVILPDAIQIIDANTVLVEFNTPQAGVARVLFLD